MGNVVIVKQNSEKTVIGSFLLKRQWILLSLFIVTPLGLLCELYRGFNMRWFQDYGVGVMYEIFWCLAVFFFKPRKQSISKITLVVFVITCCVEVSQLWHPWFLQQIRSTFLGNALLGNTFTWWDFPHYLLGCLICWFWMLGIFKLMSCQEEVA